MDSKRFNIWMLTKWYPNEEDPQFGVFIQKHAKAIRGFHNITVLYIHSSSVLATKFAITESDKNGFPEIIVYYRRNSSGFKKILNPFKYLKALSIGIDILNNKFSPPDIIHSYILTRTGLIAWYLSKRKKIPFLVSEQWSGYVTGKFLRSSLIKKIITGFVVKRASAVTAVSEFLRSRMIACRLTNSNFTVIPNIIEEVSLSPTIRRDSFINVLIVADLVDAIKNISGVIRMISTLNDDIPFKLRIIGHGIDEEALKKLASGFNLLDNKIFFEGLKDNTEVYAYLKECDFLVMNSRFETFSLICAEAMSCGKPVLATRCGGPNEFVTAETGILFEPGNDMELKDKFLFMLSHFQEYDEQKIKQYADNLFSARKAAKSFHHLYSSMISKRVF